MIRPAHDLIPVPPGVEPAAAIEVPLMWVTAWQMLTRLVSLPQGSAILCVGACGAVGRGLVTLGRHLGHHVIGTCSASNLPLVESFGATAINYRQSDLLMAIRVASGGTGVAAAFDAIGGGSWETSWQSLAPGGLLVAYGLQDFLDSNAPAGEAVKAMHMLNQIWIAEGERDGTHRSTTFYDIRIRRGSHPDEYRADAEHLLNLIADGKACPPAAELLPLSQACEAHRRIATGGLQRRLVLCP